MKQPSTAKFGFLVIAVYVGIVLAHAAFWLGMIAGALWLLRHFGVFKG